MEVDSVGEGPTTPAISEPVAVDEPVRTEPARAEASSVKEGSTPKAGGAEADEPEASKAEAGGSEEASPEAGRTGAASLEEPGRAEGAVAGGMEEGGDEGRGEAVGQEAGIAEAGRTEVVSTEPVATEGVRTEPAKSEAGREEEAADGAEADRMEVVSPEPSIAESVRTEPTIADAVRTEPIKAEAPRMPVKQEAAAKGHPHVAIKVLEQERGSASAKPSWNDINLTFALLHNSTYDYSGLPGSRVPRTPPKLKLETEEVEYYDVYAEAFRRTLQSLGSTQARVITQPSQRCLLLLLRICRGIGVRAREQFTTNKRGAIKLDFNECPQLQAFGTMAWQLSDHLAIRFHYRTALRQIMRGT